MMEDRDTEKRLRLASTLKKSQLFEQLFASEDFQTWRSEVIQARLESYLNQAKQADLTTSEGQEYALNALRSYQQLKYVTEDIFKLWEQTGQRTKEVLSQLGKK